MDGISSAISEIAFGRHGDLVGIGQSGMRRKIAIKRDIHYVVIQTKSLCDGRCSGKFTSMRLPIIETDCATSSHRQSPMRQPSLSRVRQRAGPINSLLRHVSFLMPWSQQLPVEVPTNDSEKTCSYCFCNLIQELRGECQNLVCRINSL